MCRRRKKRSPSCLWEPGQSHTDDISCCRSGQTLNITPVQGGISPGRRNAGGQKLFLVIPNSIAGVTNEGKTLKKIISDHGNTKAQQPGEGRWIPCCVSGTAEPFRIGTQPQKCYLRNKEKGREQGHPDTPSPPSPSASSPTEVPLQQIYRAKRWKTWKGILWAFNLPWIQRL